ncbi:unnamed protein product [Closterium sp. NIES-54]
MQPEGLDDGSGRVCRLKKAIYGLKQAPRAWYQKLEETLLAGGFKKSECDHSFFLLQEKEQFLMLLVYVDDIVFFSESSAMIERVEEMLEMEFTCSKMGDVKYYLGMHVERDLDKGVLRLHQRKYCEGLAEKYGLQDGGKPATPLPSGFTVETCADEEVVGESDRKLFHSMVGALNYAANHTRPDIAFATSRLASVVSRPSHEQLEAAKRLVRYVSATAFVGFVYSSVRQRQQRGAADLGKGEILFTCYTDASFNSMKTDGTSIGGYVVLFGGGAVSWCSKKQNEVGLSSCETEYMALHHGVKEVVWVRRLLEEIGVWSCSLKFVSGRPNPQDCACQGAASGGAAFGGAECEGVESGDAEPGGAGLGGTEPKGAEPGGAESEGVESWGAEPRDTASTGGAGGSAARGTGAGGAGVTAGAGGTGGARAAGPGGARTRGTRAARAGGVGDSAAGDPGARGTGAGGAGAPTVSRLLAAVVTDHSFESTAASTFVAKLVDFAAACPLDYLTALVAESESASPPSVGGECALGTNVLEDRQEDFECLTAAIPHLWQTAMDAEMASWKSTGTYIDTVPPPGANIVDGMWIFRVKRPPGSPPVFKAHYIARGFSQRQGVDFFQNFSPTPKMTTF